MNEKEEICPFIQCSCEETIVRQNLDPKTMLTINLWSCALIGYMVMSCITRNFLISSSVEISRGLSGHERCKSLLVILA